MKDAELSWEAYAERSGYEAAMRFSLVHDVPMADVVALFKANYIVGFVSGQQHTETRRAVQSFAAEVKLRCGFTISR